MENLLPLLEMGFTLDDLHVALNRGYQTAEEAVAYLTGEMPTTGTDDGSAHLVLGNASQSESIFGRPTPFTIDSPQLNWPDQGTSCIPLQTSETVPVSEPVLSRHAQISEDAITFQREEARRNAEMIRKERRDQNRMKAQLLAEVKADREEKRRQQCAVNATNEPRPPTPQRSDRIRIRVHPGGSCPNPLILAFPPSATYRDLLSQLQQVVFPTHPLTSVHLSSANSADSPAMTTLRNHLNSVRVTDPCLQLIATAWPRRTLPHCATLEIEQDTGGCLAQTLVNLGLSDGSGLSVHHANCAFEEAVVAEQSQVEASMSVEDPAPEQQAIEQQPDSGSEAEDEASSVLFPPGGQQLVPQPPGGYMPRSGRTLAENLRHRAAMLEAELHQREHQQELIEAEDMSVSEPRWSAPSRLEDLSFRYLLDLFTNYLHRLTRGSQDLDPSGSDQVKGNEGSLLYYTMNSMNGPWPEHLGQKLITALCEQSLFNVKTATLLRNCVTKLNLNYYPLVTTELITCLVTKWPDLMELRLNGLQTGQIQPETVELLGGLVNLRLLSLNGLSAVCDRSLKILINLPELRVLRISSTNVTDAGWIGLATNSSVVASHRPLAELDVSGLRSNLTSPGLDAIVQLFPNLRRLTIAASEVTTSVLAASSHASPLTFLTDLDISDCALLESLPTVLVPPLSSTSSTGLRLLKVHRCSTLNLVSVFDQLQGHPLRHMDGLESVPSLNASLLERYCGSGFPLTELQLRQINSSWMVQSLSLLSRILGTLATHTLVHLSFPQRKINQAADSGECLFIAVISLLKRFARLQTLDLGGQLSDESEVRELESTMLHLPDLTNIVVSNLPSSLCQVLRKSCEHRCTIHFQHVR